MGENLMSAPLREVSDWLGSFTIFEAGVPDG
jgi:hypothetical protein